VPPQQRDFSVRDTEASEEDDVHEDDEDQQDDLAVGPDDPALGFARYPSSGTSAPTPTRHASDVELKKKLSELDPKQAEAARAGSRDVIESNKGCTASVEVALAQDASTIAHVGANQFAADLLGLSREGYGTNSALSPLVWEASDARAQVLSHRSRRLQGQHPYRFWRSVNAGTAHYLLFLEQCG